MDVDKLLASLGEREQTRCTAMQWEAIARLALQRFSAFLGLPVVHGQFEGEDFEGGFSISIYGGDATGKYLRSTWRGVLGADIGGAHDAEISAIIFLYSDGKRVIARSHGDYLLYRYERGADGKYNWTAAGWETDEHDEFSFFDQDFLEVPELDVTRPQSV